MNADFIFISSVLSAVVIYAALRIYGAYSAREFYRLQALDRWSALFAEEVGPIIDNPDTPRQALEILAFVNRQIGDPSAVAPLCFALRNRAPRPSPLSEIAACEKALREQIADTICAGVLAVTYSNWFWGVRARAILAGLITEAARNPKPIMDVIKTMPAAKAERLRPVLLKAA